jgi:hypothetical protein
MLPSSNGRHGWRIGLMRMLLGAFLGVVLGAVATAILGAVIGLLLWATGLAFAYSWLDWPIGGALFGLVIGALGGAIGGAAQGTRVRRMKQVTVLAGATLGALVGVGPFWQADSAGELILFATFGAVGGAVGTAVGGTAGSADSLAFCRRNNKPSGG